MTGPRFFARDRSGNVADHLSRLLLIRSPRRSGGRLSTTAGQPEIRTQASGGVGFGGPSAAVGRNSSVALRRPRRFMRRGGGGGGKGPIEVGDVTDGGQFLQRTASPAKNRVTLTNYRGEDVAKSGQNNRDVDGQFTAKAYGRVSASPASTRRRRTLYLRSCIRAARRSEFFFLFFFFFLCFFSFSFFFASFFFFFFYLPFLQPFPDIALLLRGVTQPALTSRSPARAGTRNDAGRRSSAATTNCRSAAQSGRAWR